MVDTRIDEALVTAFDAGTRSPDRVYAAGTRAGSGASSYERLYLLSSDDFGTSWSLTTHPDSAAGVTTWAVKAVELAGRETVLLATSHGVFAVQLD
jgi:hypothetical protein